MPGPSAEEYSCCLWGPSEVGEYMQAISGRLPATEASLVMSALVSVPS